MTKTSITVTGLSMRIIQRQMKNIHSSMGVIRARCSCKLYEYSIENSCSIIHKYTENSKGRLNAYRGNICYDYFLNKGELWF